MKKLSLLSLLLALTISLTACTGGELKVYNGFNKMQDITSIETETEMNFTFKGEGFSEEEQVVFDQISAMFNDSSVKIHQKSTQNKEKTVAKAEMNTDMNFGGMGMNTKVWVDVDMSKDKPKVVEIIKMPQMLMASMATDGTPKEYVVYDIGDILNQEDTLNFTELVNFIKEFQPKLTEFAKSMEKDFKPSIGLAKEKGKREIDGKKLDIYELKLNDDTLKELVKYAVNYSLDSEVVMNFIKEYMNQVTKVAFANMPENERADGEKEIKSVMEEVEKKLPEFKTQFNKFMEDYKDIKILGQNGIKIEYGIDNKGYIVHEKGNIDLRFDLGNISKAIGEEEVKGIINLGINYNSKSYNINQDIKIEMPSTNKDNSINFVELMENQMNQIQSLQPQLP